MDRITSEQLPDFIFQRHGQILLWINRRLSDPSLVERMTHADRFFQQPDCQIIKDERKIKIGRFRLHFNGKEDIVYLKRYNAFSWRYRLSTLITRSGAVRSLRGAVILTEAKISTVVPLAAVEMRCYGMLTGSFFLSKEIQGSKTADSFWREELAPLKEREGRERRRKFLKGLAMLFHSLHARDVYHNDLKDANILVVAARGELQSFFLLDLQGVRQYRKLSRRRRIKNLVQLNRTLGKYARRTERLYFLKCYFGQSFADRREKRYWVSRIIDQSKRTDRRKS